MFIEHFKSSESQITGLFQDYFFHGRDEEFVAIEMFLQIFNHTACYKLIIL